MMSGVLDNTIGIAVLAVSMSIYLSVMHPSVGDGDSPEFNYKSKILVAPHPPGYPLLLLLGHAALRIADVVSPLLLGRSMSLFEAHNTMSVVLSSVAVWAVFRTARLLKSSLGASIAAAFLFGFAPHLRTYATQIEVFPLNNCLVALLLLITVKFDLATTTGVRKTWLFVGCLTSGLCMSNQHTSAFFIVPIALWVVLIRWRSAWRLSLPCLIFIALGLLPYAILPISMHLNDQQWLFAGWGATDTWQGFLDHILRRDYGTLSLIPDLDKDVLSKKDPMRNWQLYGQEVQQQTLNWLWILAIVGVVSGVAWTSRNRNERPPVTTTTPREPSRSLWCLLVIVYIVYLAVMNTLSNLNLTDGTVLVEVMRRFWFQPLLPLVLCIAKGFTVVLHSGLPRNVFTTFLDIGLGVAIASAQIMLHWEDNSDSYALEHYGRMLLDGFPQNAVVFIHGEVPHLVSSALAYGLGMRQDLILCYASFIFSPFFASNLLKSKGIRLPGSRYGLDGLHNTFNNKGILDTFIRKAKRRVFYIGPRFSTDEDLSHGDSYAVRYVGFANEFVPKDAFMAMGDVAFGEANADAFEDWRVKGPLMKEYVQELLYKALPIHISPYLTRPYASDTWESDALTNVKASLTTNAEQLLVFAAYDDPRMPDVKVAREIADLVSLNHSHVLWTVPEYTSLESTEIPPRYRMLVMARALLQHNRAILPSSSSSAMSAATAPDGGASPPVSVDELLMFRILQQLMRFHFCAPSPNVHEGLFNEIAAVSARVLDAAREMGIEESDDFSRREILDYMVWVKRYRTRPHPSCRSSSSK